MASDTPFGAAPGHPGRPQMRSPETQTHTVRPGDTLGAIARRYGTTVQALAQRNNIENPDLIHPGQVIRITGGSRAVEPVNDDRRTNRDRWQGTDQQYDQIIESLIGKERWIDKRNDGEEINGEMVRNGVYRDAGDTWGDACRRELRGRLGSCRTPRR